MTVQAGDRVTLREFNTLQDARNWELTYGSSSQPLGTNRRMAEWFGTTVTVQHANDRFFTIHEDDGWSWCYSWINPSADIVFYNTFEDAVSGLDPTTTIARTERGFISKRDGSYFFHLEIAIPHRRQRWFAQVRGSIATARNIRCHTLERTKTVAKDIDRLYDKWE
jgi:hypothetical protein